jgi:hypothetical protein
VNADYNAYVHSGISSAPGSGFEQGGKMKKFFLSILLMVFSAFLFSDVRNRDKPLKGEWDFRLEKVWEVERAGESVFGRPFTLTVAEDETIYVFDMKNDENYILDKNGTFIKTFGRSGQGPGELTGQEHSIFFPRWSISENHWAGQDPAAPPNNDR